MRRSKLKIGGLGLALALVSSACTGQIPNSFRFKQVTEDFDVNFDFNTKIDLLWVVDNSASMDVSQEKLRNGFESFADRYMKPTWDIRVAVITTDTFMADPAFSDYLNTTIPGTTGYTSTHISSRLATWQNPTWNTSLVNTTTGAFDSGVKYGELIPIWGSNYARLLPGYHDGPIPAICFEALPIFLNGVTECSVRDDQNAYNGTGKCLNPDTGAGEDASSQCVNTIQNDTVRSGKAIIETKPPEGTPANAAWTQQLVDDFVVNLTTGSAGQGSERGLGSVLQLLSDNESTDTRFFREGSIRGIIFVSDEDDQTLEIPDPVPAGFTPSTDYSSTCTAKTVDSHTYTLSTCPDESKLVSVSDVKDQLDTFFNTLDGSTNNPNYFIASIVAMTGDDIDNLQTARTAAETAAGIGTPSTSVDRGSRYIELGDLVGGESTAMSIAESNYSGILEAIGQAIVSARGSFELNRAPTAQEDMIIKIIRSDGSETTLDNSQYSINGKWIRFTSIDFVLGLSSEDRISINYQPNSAF